MDHRLSRVSKEQLGVIIALLGRGPSITLGLLSDLQSRCSGRQPACKEYPRLADAAKPVFDFRAHFCHSAPMETHAFGFRLRVNAQEGKGDLLSVSRRSRRRP
jgi:hypothetical protein